MNLIQKITKPLGLATFLVATILTIPNTFAQNDPPGRVARVSYSYGNISFADAGSNEWTTLTPNRPISTGDSLLVGEQARAEIHVGGSALRLHERTQISFIHLTDDSTQIKLSQGVMVLKVRSLFERENFEVSTPNLNFNIQEPGEYRINVNDDNTSTIIVRRGAGVAQGDRDIVTLREGEQSRFSGTNLNHTQISYAPPIDTFDQWAIDRDRAEQNSISARYVSREVIGYQQLDEYGSWETHPEYGAIWTPRGISVGWAPYRDGRWAWVAPWGWTWVDRSPWGFAPYHYGRWAHVGSRWCWVPGRLHREHRPVYAPALVAFIGAGHHGLTAGVSVGIHSSVTWFPLGPGEVYRPHYTKNPRYIENINHTVVNNVTVINNPRNVYINQHVTNAVTSVPNSTFVRGEHVFPASRSILSGQIKRMEVATEAPNITPEKGNRFGEGRPRSWQGNDADRNRPNISEIKRVETITNPTSTPLNTQNTPNTHRNGGNDPTNISTPSTVNNSGITPMTPRRSSEEINVERSNRAEQYRPPSIGIRIDDSSRTGINNARIENHRELPTSSNRFEQISSPNTVIPTPNNARPIERNNERNNERYNERNNERNNERIIERGNDRPINIPPSNNAGMAVPTPPTPRIVERSESRPPSPTSERYNDLPIKRMAEPRNERNVEREERPMTMQRETPQPQRFEQRPAPVEQRPAPVEIRRDAPVSIPPPQKVDKVEKSDKTKDKTEDYKNKRER